MGDALMKLVARDWGDLSGNGYKALMTMAATAMDSDNPPLYWRGWEHLALTGLGRRDMPGEFDESPEATRTRRSCSELVRRAIAELVDRGAVTVHKRGRPGVRACYALNLNQRFVGSLSNKTLESTQQKVAVPQQNVGANYQHSQDSQDQKPISSSPAAHQAMTSPVDKSRSTPRHLASIRARADQELTA